MGLTEHMIGDVSNELGYRLTRKGIAFLRSQGIGSAEATEYRAAYRTTYNHDDYLVGLGAIFRAFPGVVEYWPEHLVRQKLALKYGY